jgi:hypothetical protein
MYYFPRAPRIFSCEKGLPSEVLVPSGSAQFLLRFLSTLCIDRVEFLGWGVFVRLLNNFAKHVQRMSTCRRSKWPRDIASDCPANKIEHCIAARVIFFLKLPFQLSITDYKAFITF